jgi:membrane protease YdiL (CAAX protease family)
MYAVDTTNPWVSDVEAARRSPPAWAATLIAAVFSVAVLMTFRASGAGLESAIAKSLGDLPPTWVDIWASGALQAMIFGLFLIAALAAAVTEGRSLWPRRAGAVSQLAIGGLIGAGGFAAAAGLAALAGAVIVVPSLSGPMIPAAVLVGALLVALQSVAEEIFFRGWLQPLLCARWGAWIGLTVASALFAGLHIIAGAHGLTAVVNLFLGGLLFGLLALRSGGLFAPAAAHFAWNWTESGVLGLDPQPTGSLFNLGLTGPAFWSGGADTMNGSLATSLVLVSLVAATALIGRRRGL